MDASDTPLVRNPFTVSEHDHALAIDELRNAITVIRAHAQMTQRRLDRLGSLDPQIGAKAMAEIGRATRCADRALSHLENSLGE